MHRTLFRHHGPVRIHLPEHVLGIGVLHHIVNPYLPLHFLKLMRMGMIAVAESSLTATPSYLVVEVADGLSVLQRLGCFAPRGDHISHARCLMRLDGLIPPFQRLREIVAGKFFGIQVAIDVRRDRCQSRLLAVLSVLFGRDAIELPVLVVGCLDARVSHLAQAPEHLCMVVGVQLGIAYHVANAVELHSHLFGLVQIVSHSFQIVERLLLAVFISPELGDVVDAPFSLLTAE